MRRSRVNPKPIRYPCHFSTCTCIVMNRCSLHMVIHDAITNDACSTMEGLCLLKTENGENSCPIGTELQNGVFILTKTPFASCLHHQ
jgi:hypothetical protein